MKIIKMNYIEYKDDLNESFKDGEKRGMALIMTAVRDYITTGGQKTTLKAGPDDDITKFFNEVKTALEKK